MLMAESRSRWSHARGRRQPRQPYYAGNTIAVCRTSGKSGRCGPPRDRPYEVCQVLEAKQRWPRLAGGRPLIVAVWHTSGLIWKILGAREMAPAERAEFERWEEMQ